MEDLERELNHRMQMFRNFADGDIIEETVPKQSQAYAWLSLATPLICIIGYFVWMLLAAALKKCLQVGIMYRQPSHSKVKQTLTKFRNLLLVLDVLVCAMCLGFMDLRFNIVSNYHQETSASQGYQLEDLREFDFHKAASLYGIPGITGSDLRETCYDDINLFVPNTKALGDTYYSTWLSSYSDRSKIVDRKKFNVNKQELETASTLELMRLHHRLDFIHSLPTKDLRSMVMFEKSDLFPFQVGAFDIPMGYREAKYFNTSSGQDDLNICVICYSHPTEYGWSSEGLFFYGLFITMFLIARFNSLNERLVFLTVLLLLVFYYHIHTIVLNTRDIYGLYIPNYHLAHLLRPCITVYALSQRTYIVHYMTLGYLAVQWVLVFIFSVVERLNHDLIQEQQQHNTSKDRTESDKDIPEAEISF